MNGTYSSVEDASGGTVPLSQRCRNCGEPCMYRVDKGGAVVAAFCPALMCVRALVEVREEEAKP